MNNKVELQKLVEHFDANIDFYKDTKKAYNEHSCRIEFIDPFLKILGWDVANEKGLHLNIEKLLLKIIHLVQIVRTIQ